MLFNWIEFYFIFYFNLTYCILYIFSISIYQTHDKVK